MAELLALLVVALTGWTVGTVQTAWAMGEVRQSPHDFVAVQPSPQLPLQLTWQGHQSEVTELQPVPAQIDICPMCCRELVTQRIREGRA